MSAPSGVDWKELIPPIAHDVRALVRKGLSNAQFLEKLIRPEAGTEISTHLRAVIESQFDLNRLFVRLIALADAGNSPHKSSPYSVDTTDLETAILGAKLECRDELQRSGGELVIGPLPPCAVPQKTQTILKELFDNSIRYAAPDRPPRVEISASLAARTDAGKDGRKILVRVSDNGSGLPAGYTDKLFQPMQRLDPARSGFGLGLAIAKAVVEAARGGISFVASDPGATFVFEIPCSDLP